MTRIPLNNGVSQWITGSAARTDGHAYRRRASAVLTGVGSLTPGYELLTIYYGDGAGGLSAPVNVEAGGTAVYVAAGDITGAVLLGTKNGENGTHGGARAGSKRKDGKIRVAIVGVGNCASSLVQGRYYYENAKKDDFVPGLMHVKFGDYHVNDVQFVAAFDVDEKTGAPRFRLSYRTVGQSLALPIARRHAGWDLRMSLPSGWMRLP